MKLVISPSLKGSEQTKTWLTLQDVNDCVCRSLRIGTAFIDNHIFFSHLLPLKFCVSVHPVIILRANRRGINPSDQISAVGLLGLILDVNPTRRDRRRSLQPATSWVKTERWLISWRVFWVHGRITGSVFSNSYCSAQKALALILTAFTERFNLKEAWRLFHKPQTAHGLKHR